MSKFLSLVLRHEPEKLNLNLDEEGFTPLGALLEAMRQKSAWRNVTESRIREVVALSDKQRYEIVGDRIRARYGHSVVRQIIYPAIEPPAILYHVTSPRALDAILREGLRPMERQYVHLSSAIEQAEIVGRRHAHSPKILIVDAGIAHGDGVAFYNPEPRLYLADLVPEKYLRIRE